MEEGAWGLLPAKEAQGFVVGVLRLVRRIGRDVEEVPGPHVELLLADGLCPAARQVVPHGVPGGVWAALGGAGGMCSIKTMKL